MSHSSLMSSIHNILGSEETTAVESCLDDDVKHHLKALVEEQKTLVSVIKELQHVVVTAVSKTAFDQTQSNGNGHDGKCSEVSAQRRSTLLSSSEELEACSSDSFSVEQTEKKPTKLSKQEQLSTRRRPSIWSDQTIDSTTWPYLEVRQYNRQTNLIMHTATTLASLGSFIEYPPKGKLGYIPCYILEPTSPIRLAFDAFGMFILLYDLFVTPFLSAWNIPLDGPVLYFTLGVAAFWTLDIFVVLRTGIYHKGELEIRSFRIFMNYLKGSLISDVLLVAVDWVAIIMSQTTVQAGQIRLFRVVRFLRFLNTSRIARVSEGIQRLAYRFDLSSTSMSWITIIKLLFVALWINHLSGCLLWALGVDSVFGSDTGESWVDEFKLRDQPASYQYSTSLHWAYMQLGTGNTEVVPTNTAERVFGIVVVMNGMVFFSWFLSSLSTAMLNVGVQKVKIDSHLAELKKFLRQFKVSPKLSLSVQKHAHAVLTTPKPLTINDVPMLNLLSRTVRSELQAELCEPHVGRVGFFRAVKLLDRTLMKEVLVNAIDFTVISDVIFSGGVPAEFSYFVDFGKIDYIQLPSFSNVKEKKTTRLKDEYLISEPALWVHWTHVGTAIASPLASLLAVNVEKLSSVLGRQSDTRELAAEYARVFQLSLAACAPPKTRWPDDLQVGCAKFDEIISICSQEVQDLISMAALNVLNQLQVGWPWQRNIEDLGREVKNNLCVLTVNEQNEVERLVAVSNLKLRDAHSRLLVELGIWKDKSLNLRCCLPERYQGGGETPREALARLLEGQFEHLFPYIELDETLTELLTDCSISKMCNIQTKCLRTLFSANLKQGDDIEQLLDSLCLEEESKINQSFNDSKIIGLPSSDGSIRLYTWIWESDFDDLGEVNTVPDSYLQRVKQLDLTDEIRLKLDLLLAEAQNLKENEAASGQISPDRNSLLRHVFDQSCEITDAVAEESKLVSMPQPTIPRHLVNIDD